MFVKRIRQEICQKVTGLSKEFVKKFVTKIHHKNSSQKFVTKIRLPKVNPKYIQKNLKEPK